MFHNIPWHPDYQINWETNEVKSINFKRRWEERILKPAISKNGYRMIWIYIEKGNVKIFSFHKLVMLVKTWHLAPEWLEICHNDWNPQNNHPNNLRYDTHSENTKDRYRLWYKWRIKPISQYSKWWEFIRYWDSAKEVTRALWINNKNIWSCCSWKRKLAGGFIWKFK